MKLAIFEATFPVGNFTIGFMASWSINGLTSSSGSIFICRRFTSCISSDYQFAAAKILAFLCFNIPSKSSLNCYLRISIWPLKIFGSSKF